MASTQVSEATQAVIARYEKERDKRLRKDGNDQYVDVRSEEVKDLDYDPWVNYNDPQVNSPPLKDGDSLKVLISGAGINGLTAAARLIEAGIDSKNVVLVENAGGFGGTWYIKYWNRYPGVMCDVEGYCYVPFLEETGYRPRHKYSYGAEIRGQMERSAAHFGIRGQFCTKINSKIWDEEKKLWVVTMTRTVGSPPTSTTLTVTADYVVVAGGVLAIPKVPKLPGLNEFRKKKQAFHSARWDYAYTGGTQEAPDLVNLRGKRVAIIGTGATAVQIIPELAKWADRVYVVQRTPTYVAPRNQTETDPETWAKITSQKGWQNRRRVVFDAYVSNSKGYGPDIIDDGWTHTTAGSGFLGSKGKIVTPDKVEQHIKDLYELDFPRTEYLRGLVDEIVEDKDTAEKLKAWYGSWCKRPSFHDEYLQAFNKPNVTLIDTDGKGLERFTGNGIVCAGTEYEVDAVVLATGFKMAHLMDPSEKLDAVIKGRDGLGMRDYWFKPEAGSLFGLMMPKFPNLFCFLGRGAGASWNMTSVLDVQAKLTASIVTQAQKRAGGMKERVVVEASEEAEREYGMEVAKRAGWYTSVPICTPGYFNGEGAGFKVDRAMTEEEQHNEGKKMPWGNGPVDYREMIEDFAAKGDLKGFNVEVVGHAQTRL
ncbi:FAD/NAD(P)-binding domain-containing protein [Corynespora cassiicola Philippines]|uniref:FAD/NAD(P)-binding domain-containing protein n=1 Tax=Corynespora cassiicola Philippines TaxID=1448308 RepID=A0A2T2NHY6_CORCC|nr:FAD/NAD(P)-binding domain-containing protein [Corynespora cassiicola Philippines]